MGDQAHAGGELAELAEALTEQGYRAVVVTPAPYLAVDVPGAVQPYMVYSSGGRFWWHTPQTIAPSGQAASAAELITWGLRALRDGSPAGDAAAAPAGLGGEREC